MTDGIDWNYPLHEQLVPRLEGQPPWNMSTTELNEIHKECLCWTEECWRVMHPPAQSNMPSCITVYKVERGSFQYRNAFNTKHHLPNKQSNKIKYNQVAVSRTILSNPWTSRKETATAHNQRDENFSPEKTSETQREHSTQTVNSNPQIDNRNNNR